MTTSTTSSTTAASTTFSTVNKVGLGLASALAIGDVVSVLAATPVGQTGPPRSVLVLDCLLGLVTLAAVGFALARRNRGATRIAAAARIVSAISAMPAFFVNEVSPGLKLLAGGIVLVTVLVVVMILTPARSSV